MFIRQWMTTDVQTVTPDTLMMTAASIMKSHRVRRLPVVDEQGRLIGIVTDRDIKEASPSKATTLDTHELYYLLSEIKIADVMTKDPLALHPDDTLEHAVILMGKHRYGGLPVIDDRRKVVGVISYSDIFMVISDIIGLGQSDLRIIMENPASSKDLLKLLGEIIDMGAKIVSVLNLPAEPDPTIRWLYLRFSPPNDMSPAQFIDHIDQNWHLLYWSQDKPIK